ncbi:MAG: helix-turn-helix domain-containing protein [Anaerolineae bacterium]|nr:helix-turn-helix domain-containing protein [Anaerolineae bacterium]
MEPQGAPETALQRLLDHPQVYVRNRAAIVVLTEQGWTVEQIAAEVGVSPKTVEKWQAAWSEDGMNIFPGGDDTEDNRAKEPGDAPKDEPEAEVPAVTLDDNLEEAPVIGLALTPDVFYIPVGLAEDAYGSDTLMDVAEAMEAAPQEVPEPPRDWLAVLSFPRSVPLAPTDAMGEAGRRILLGQLADMLRQEPVARLGEDSEGVHKMRWPPPNAECLWHLWRLFR